MKTLLQIRLCSPQSDNRKSKIQNRKLAGIAAIVVALAACGTRVEAQQANKNPCNRIPNYCAAKEGPE